MIKSDAIKTIREALILGWSCDIPEKRRQALVALDYLTHDSCPDARELAYRLGSRAAELYECSVIDVACSIDTFTDEAAALIQSAFDKIRRECADKSRNAIKDILMMDFGFDRMDSEIVMDKSEYAIFGK